MSGFETVTSRPAASSTMDLLATVPKPYRAPVVPTAALRPSPAGPWPGPRLTRPAPGPGRPAGASTATISRPPSSGTRSSDTSVPGSEPVRRLGRGLRPPRPPRRRGSSFAGWGLRSSVPASGVVGERPMVGERLDERLGRRAVGQVDEDQGALGPNQVEGQVTEVRALPPLGRPRTTSGRGTRRPCTRRPRPDRSPGGWARRVMPQAASTSRPTATPVHSRAWSLPLHPARASATATATRDARPKARCGRAHPGRVSDG